MTAVRETFTSYLTGPTLEVAPLTARLPDQEAREEERSARQLSSFVLFTSVKQVHSSGGGGSGLLGRVAGSAIQQGAYAAGGVTGNAAGQIGINAAGGAAGAAATNYGSYTKPNDELTLTARLESGDGKVLVNSTNKKKAGVYRRGPADPARRESRDVRGGRRFQGLVEVKQSSGAAPTLCAPVCRGTQRVPAASRWRDAAALGAGELAAVTGRSRSRHAGRLGSAQFRELSDVDPSDRRSQG